MGHPFDRLGLDPRGSSVLRSAVALARSSGTLTPAHLLVAIAEEGASVLTTVIPVQTIKELANLPTGPGTGGVFFGMLSNQALGTARALAQEGGKLVSPEHLLVSLIDQSASVTTILERAGVDAGDLRRTTLDVLGLPANTPRLDLEPLPPRGTFDNPALPIDELDHDAWAELQSRLDRLPLRRLRKGSDLRAIMRNEGIAVGNLVARRQLDADQYHSLAYHHWNAVMERASEARPDLVGFPADGATLRVHSGILVARGKRHRRLIPLGWVCWVGNRRANAHARWFRWTGQRV